MRKRLKNVYKFSPRNLTIFAVIFAVVGSILLIITHASSPTASVEPETSNVTCPATTGTDSTASGGSYVQFKKGTCGGKGAGYAKLGFFPDTATHEGDQLYHLQGMATWLNRNSTPTIPFVLEMTDANSPDIMSGNGWGMMVDTAESTGINYPIRNFSQLTPKPTLIVSVPLAFIYDGCNPQNTTCSTICPFSTTNTHCFDKIASGQFDSQYRSLMNYLINGGYANNLIIRLGWEYDGDWMPWSAKTNYAQFKAAYIHVHDLMKGMAPNVKFDLAGDSLTYIGADGPASTSGTAAANTKARWDQAWPGDSYVDIIGMDVYWVPTSCTDKTATGTCSFPSFSKYQYLLQMQEDYAKAHGKTVSYPEWGEKPPTGYLELIDDPSFIQNMYDWFNGLPASGAGSLAYHSYFNSNGDGATRLYNVYSMSPNPYNSTTLFKTLFGGSQ